MPSETQRPAANATTVLVVDPRVTNWQGLVAGVGANVDVVVLNPARDGVTQVSQALAGLSNVRNLEFLTDGTPGSITLGGSTLNLAMLTSRASDISGWSAHLAANADIVFWGCDVGQGSTGAAFVADMHTLTGATIGASAEAVGSAALGGGWSLDVTTGPLHRDATPFSASAMASYTGILDTPDPTVTLSTSGTLPHEAGGTVLLGDTINFSLSFTNAAANATGYGPYIELFAPNSLTLSSITSGGIALTPIKEAVDATGTFTNPLTGATETAPAGDANGTAYIITLPYGSFTPGEPAVGVSGSFSMSDASALVGTTLPIDARAGFEFGAVATGGIPITGADVSSPEQVLLIESWLTVATQPGEGETATGPDFPVTYTLNLEPAPAVAATNTPITNLTITVPLPNAVIETGSASASGGGSASVTSASVAGGTEQTLHINYASLSGTQAVTFQAYVPEFYQYTANGDTGGAPILDPSTGAPVQIAVSPAYTLTSDAWNGIAITGDTGDVSGAVFEAKSLAVQLVADTGSALPTQDITYTLKWQVSDYFGVSGLGLNATLGDGLTFDPAVTPVLSVTAGTHGGVASGTGSFVIAPSSETTATVNADYPETVQSGGSGANISYAFNGADGTTLLNFNAGGLLGGIYGAGTTGTVTFAATVLPAYPTQTDNVAGAGGFLRESDSVGTSSSGDTATSLYRYTGSAYAATGNAIADGTATPVDTLPDGSLALSVVDVNGAAYTGQTIAPGATVVYQLVYTLAQPGDFAGLNLAAYIPEPVFSVLHPSNPDLTTNADFSGNGTSVFALNAAATAATLASGDYTYAVTSGLTGVTVTGATGAEPTNSVAFTVASPAGQNFDKWSTGTGAQQTVTIDFAVTASSLPFVNGLHLTAQGDSNYTPAKAGPFSFQQIQMLYLGDPLLSVQQGVVSLINDAGTDISAQSGIGWTLPATGTQSSPTATTNATASALFDAAGRPGVFVNGATIPAVLTPADDNLSLSGAQAGDTVRIVDAVQNTGNYPAYDVIVKDALAQGLTTSNVPYLVFTRGDGTVLETLDPATGAQVTGAAARADYFGSGVLLTVAGSTATPVLASASDPNPLADIVYVTYDVSLPNSTPTAASLTGKATIVAWTNQNEYSAATGFTFTDPIAGTDGNFADDNALGAVLSSSATVATVAPAITDTITGAADASDTGLTGGGGIPANTFNANAATVVPGETLSLSATVTLPQGVNGLVAPIDILPTGLSIIGTAGTYHATYQDNQGDAPVDLTGSVTIDTATNTLTLTPQNRTVAPHIGGDQPGTITITYQALVPQTQATAIDTTSWGTNASTGNLTRTDSFAANNEGLGYATTTATSTATTTGTGNASGIPNAVTVVNPLVTAAITELNGTNGQNVYSNEALTYQLTLTNDSGTATAYDLNSSLSLPSGVTYVAGSLAQTSGSAAQQVTTGNVASNGAASPGSALAGITLAPGATAVFTFQGTVNDNLPDGTVLTVTAKPAWESLPASAAFDGAGNVNPQAQAYAGAPGSVSNSVAVLTPDLSIIGASNRAAQSFDPTARTTGTAVTTTDSEIVRMRAVLQVPEGRNGVELVITLPTGLTYQNDGSTDVLLVSPNGDFTTSLTGTGLQATSGATAINLNSQGLGLGASDPVTLRLSGGAISASGQTVTFNLGTLANNDGSALPNYAVVEFNAVVANGTAATTALQTTLTGEANGAATSTVSDYVNVVAPTVTLTKTIDGIVYNPDGSATVTYTDTEANTGNATAYDLSLTDPGAGTGTATYIGTTGPVTPTSAGANGSGFDAVLPSLSAGAAQTFTYTVTIGSGQVDTAVSDTAATAHLTSYALNPADETGNPLKETLAGSSLAPPQSSTTATAGLDLISGTVNQDTAATQGADTSLVALAGQTVGATFSGQTGTEQVTTNASGAYTILAPDNAGAVSIKVTTTAPNAPTLDAIDNHPDQAASLASTGASTSGTDPATLNFTPAGSTNYTGIAFDFWRAPDTAPVLSGGPAAPFTVTAGTAIVPFASAVVADTQLDSSFGHDFSGTTLTVQRYVGATAAPDATDVFTAASGSGLTLSGGSVLLNGASVGSYTETGGVLSVHFAATGVTQSTVDSVLQGIAYTSTAGGNATLPGIVIGAQIDDANSDPIALNGNALDPSGPHDQGPGGDLLSNVLTASVTVNPIAPALSVIGESNDTAGLGTAFNPTGETTASSVLTTDSEIVRMRAVVELPEGANNAADIVVTLPTGLTYRNDGSTDVLLVSPGGNATTSLTGTGLQLASTALSQALLSLGSASADPVSAALTGAGAITVAGQAVTFNLGNLTFASSAPGANYAVVEFNVVVADTAANGTSLTTSMHAGSNAVTTATVNDYVNVQAPDVTLTKAVESIVYNPNGTVTVTYQDTETNSGGGPAYNLGLDDPGAGPGTTVAYIGTSGPGTPSGAGGNGSHFDATLPVLGAGMSQAFTYSVTIPASQIATAVADSTATATLTSYALNPAHETGSPLQETLAGTSLIPPQHSTTATAGLDLISGTVNQDTSPTQGSDTSLVGLDGQSVSLTFAGQTGAEQVTTNGSGAYAILAPDNAGAVSIKVTTAQPNAPTLDGLDNHPDQTAGLASTGASTSGTDPATLTFTPAASTNYTGIAFDFWRPLDTAPVLSGGPAAPFVVTAGTAIVPFASAAVADTQLDGSFAHDFSGTTLTVQRYVGSTAAPDATDVFTAAQGSGLTLSGGSVLLNGTSVGTFTETAGVLSVHFAATGVTGSTVDSVLQGIAYTSTAGGNTTLPGIVIGARIDDANNDPIALNGNALDPSGPHDQGVGGDLLSNVLTASVTVNPIAPNLSVVGESNDTAGLGTSFNPTGQTTTTSVLTTDSEIVRMRAVVELPEGANNAADIVVTLPTGLTYRNDGSTDVLLVSPGGNATTSLTGSGLQLASTSLNQALLSLGSGAADPVTAALTGAVTVSGQTVTFNLGDLTFAKTASGANYAVVEFNAVVADNTANGTSLTTAMHADSNAVTTATVNDYVNVEAPVVTLTKAVESIVTNPDGTVTVTYQDTETNSGGGPAYNLGLDDPGAGPGTSVAYIGTSGPGAPSSAGANGSHFDATLPVLGAGGSQIFTYFVTIPASQVATAVADSTATATLTSYALNPAYETGSPLQETLAGTSLTPPQHGTTATAGLDLISGTVNQDTAFNQGADTSLTPLQGQTVTASFTNSANTTVTETTTTDANGNYTLLVPDSGVPVSLTATTSSPNAPTLDALDNAAALAGSVPSGTVTGSDPATVSFTTAPNTPYSPVVFDFWRPLDSHPLLPVLTSGLPPAYPLTAGGTVNPFPTATVADPQLDASFAQDYSGTTLTLQRYVNNVAAPDASDVFLGSNGLVLQTPANYVPGSAVSGTVSWNGAQIGTYTEAGGKLAISFTATPDTVNATLVDNVLQNIVYESTLTSAPLVPGIVLGAQIDDANNDPIALNGNPIDTSGPHDQGVGGDLLSNVLTATIDLSASSAATFFEPNDTNPASAPSPVAVDPGANLADIVATNGTPTAITLTISNTLPEDVLTFANTADITGSYSNGSLTLSAVNGHTPTVTEWQAALQSVQYYDSSPTPVTATRDLTITVVSGTNVATEPGTIAIVPVDDSPILDTTVAVSLPDATEYQGTGAPTPTGAVGTLVSALVSLNRNVTDTDGAGLTNGGTPTEPGIAITAVSTTDAGGRSVGTWYFSTNGGTTWTAFPTTISATQPLDLAPDARIVFEPTATNFNGQIPNAITFRAWDGFDGTVSGTQATGLTGDTVFGQAAANNTPATAYSIATESLPLFIDNVNNAPDAQGTATLPTINAANQHPAGETVAQLFGPGFSDPLDQQNIPVANPYGSTSNGFAGIVISGNAATPTQGTWEYSVNNGASWTAIPGNVSLSNAIILPAGARLAFLPNQDFVGNPGALTVNVIDSSATPIAPGLTGAQLAAEVTLAADTGVNIAATGGSTAISASTIALGTNITAEPKVIRATPTERQVEPSAPVFPDDNTVSPTGLQFFTSNDYLGRPLIPDLSLVGSVANRFIIEDQHAIVSVPPNIFVDTLPQAELSYEATLPDGQPLPSWLSFNANNLTFSGIPPVGSHGRIEMLITARDQANQTAQANFNILIGREQNDLVGLLRPGGLHARPHHLTLPPEPRTNAPVPHRIASKAAALADAPMPSATGGGFSAALHAAGPMSALGRARAWLDSLTDIDRHRPAA